MANTHSTLNALFTDIADAIRAKKNSIETIIADNFPIEIENLKTGFNYDSSYVTTIFPPAKSNSSPCKYVVFSGAVITIDLAGFVTSTSKVFVIKSPSISVPSDNV